MGGWKYLILAVEDLRAWKIFIVERGGDRCELECLRHTCSRKSLGRIWEDEKKSG